MAGRRSARIVALGMVWALGGCGESVEAIVDTAGAPGNGVAGPRPESQQDSEERQEPMGAAGGDGAGLPPSAVNPGASDESPPIEPAGDSTAEPLAPTAVDAGPPGAELPEPPRDEPHPVDEPSVEPPALIDPPAIDAPDAGGSVIAEPPPDVVDPPIVDPPVTDPPVTDPPVTDPPVTDPPVTDPPVTDPPVVEPPPQIVPSFAIDVWPIFMARCGTCHTTLRRGGHSVGSPTLATALADAQRLGATLVERLDGGGMPPACSGSPGDVGCISVPDLATIRLWIDTGMAP